MLCYIHQVLDADLPPYDEYSITMISGDEDYFELTDDQVKVLKPLDVPPGILLSEYTIGKVLMSMSEYTIGKVLTSMSVGKIPNTGNYLKNFVILFVILCYLCFSVFVPLAIF